MLMALHLPCESCLAVELIFVIVPKSPALQGKAFCSQERKTELQGNTGGKRSGSQGITNNDRHLEEEE